MWLESLEEFEAIPNGIRGIEALEARQRLVVDDFNPALEESTAKRD